ncbi:MAG: hypothetical protein ABSG42_04240 [Nitrospirota bacterium]
MEIVFQAMSFSALCIMIFGWIKIDRLRRKIPGGLAKTTSTVMSEMMGLFTLGYLILSFTPLFPQVSRDILTGVMFLFAAIFAIIVINFFSMLASQLGI